MDLGRIVIASFVIVFVGNILISGWTCYTTFCPGDRENDYVYTVVDGDGKIWYMDNGQALSETDYRNKHINLYTFKEQKDSDGK